MQYQQSTTWYYSSFMGINKIFCNFDDLACGGWSNIGGPLSQIFCRNMNWLCSASYVAHCVICHRPKYPTMLWGICGGVENFVTLHSYFDTPWAGCKPWFSGLWRAAYANSWTEAYCIVSGAGAVRGSDWVVTQRTTSCQAATLPYVRLSFFLIASPTTKLA